MKMYIVISAAAELMAVHSNKKAVYKWLRIRGARDRVGKVTYSKLLKSLNSIGEYKTDVLKTKARVIRAEIKR